MQSTPSFSSILNWMNLNWRFSIDELEGLYSPVHGVLPLHPEEVYYPMTCLILTSPPLDMVMHYSQGQWFATPIWCLKRQTKVKLSIWTHLTTLTIMKYTYFRGCPEDNIFYFVQNGHLQAEIWPCIVTRVSSFQHHHCVLYHGNWKVCNYKVRKTIIMIIMTVACQWHVITCRVTMLADHYTPCGPWYFCLLADT